MKDAPTRKSGFFFADACRMDFWVLMLIVGGGYATLWWLLKAGAFGPKRPGR